VQLVVIICSFSLLGLLWPNNGWVERFSDIFSYFIRAQKKEYNIFPGVIQKCKSSDVFVNTPHMIEDYRGRNDFN
jgi:hypothetical protein